MIEEKKQHKNYLFGLLGKNISYSFSSGYFKEKFEELELVNHEYQNFDIQSIEEFSNGKSVILAFLKFAKGIVPFAISSALSFRSTP